MMGSFLTYRKTPLYDFKTEKGVTLSFTYGATSVTGWRNTQEDRFKCIADYFGDYSFFAVYDGHGGHEISDYLEKNFHNELLNFIMNEDIPLALLLSFLTFDLHLREISKEQLLSVIGNEEFELPDRKQFIRNLSTMFDPGVAGPSQEEEPLQDDPLRCAIASETLKFLVNDDLAKEDSDDDDADYDIEAENGSNNSGSDESNKGEDQDINESDDEYECSGEENDQDSRDTPNANYTEVGYKCGSTATVVLIGPQYIYIGNVGDSKCIASINGTAVELSVDHKPTDDLEFKRIVEYESEVTEDGRIDGGLNMSRAFGDFCLKNRDGSEIEQVLICAPFITHVALSKEIEFIVIASDGIWNSWKNQEVVDFIMMRLKFSDFDVQDVCEELCRFTMASDTSGDGTGCDNMSIIVLINNQIFNDYRNIDKKLDVNKETSCVYDGMQVIPSTSDLKECQANYEACFFTSSPSIKTKDELAAEKNKAFDNFLEDITSGTDVQANEKKNNNLKHGLRCNLNACMITGDTYNYLSNISELKKAQMYYKSYRNKIENYLRQSLIAQMTNFGDSELCIILLDQFILSLPGFNSTYLSTASVSLKCCQHKCHGNVVTSHETAVQSNNENANPHVLNNIPSLKEAVIEYNKYKENVKKYANLNMIQVHISKSANKPLFNELLKGYIEPLPLFVSEYLRKISLSVKCCSHICTSQPFLIHHGVPMLQNENKLKLSDPDVIPLSDEEENPNLKGKFSEKYCSVQNEHKFPNFAASDYLNGKQSCIYTEASKFISSINENTEQNIEQKEACPMQQDMCHFPNDCKAAEEFDECPLEEIPVKTVEDRVIVDCPSENIQWGTKAVEETECLIKDVECPVEQTERKDEDTDLYNCHQNIQYTINAENTSCPVEHIEYTVEGNVDFQSGKIHAVEANKYPIEDSEYSAEEKPQKDVENKTFSVELKRPLEEDNNENSKRKKICS